MKTLFSLVIFAVAFQLSAAEQSFTRTVQVSNTLYLVHYRTDTNSRPVNFPNLSEKQWSAKITIAKTVSTNQIGKTIQGVYEHSVCPIHDWPETWVRRALGWPDKPLKVSGYFGRSGPVLWVGNEIR